MRKSYPLKKERVATGEKQDVIARLTRTIESAERRLTVSIDRLHSLRSAMRRALNELSREKPDFARDALQRALEADEVAMRKLAVAAPETEIEEDWPPPGDLDQPNAEPARPPRSLLRMEQAPKKQRPKHLQPPGWAPKAMKRKKPKGKQPKFTGAR